MLSTIWHNPKGDASFPRGAADVRILTQGRVPKVESARTNFSDGVLYLEPSIAPPTALDLHTLPLPKVANLRFSDTDTALCEFRGSMDG